MGKAFPTEQLVQRLGIVRQTDRCEEGSFGEEVRRSKEGRLEAARRTAEGLQVTEGMQSLGGEVPLSHPATPTSGLAALHCGQQSPWGP